MNFVGLPSAGVISTCNFKNDKIRTCWTCTNVRDDRECMSLGSREVCQQQNVGYYFSSLHTQSTMKTLNFFCPFQAYCKYYYVKDRWGRPGRVTRGCIDAATCAKPDYTSRTGYCGYLSRYVSFCEQCTLGTLPEHSGCIAPKMQYISRSLFDHANDEGKVFTYYFYHWPLAQAFMPLRLSPQNAATAGQK